MRTKQSQRYLFTSRTQNARISALKNKNNNAFLSPTFANT